MSLPPHDPASACAMLPGPARDALCQAIAALDEMAHDASPAVCCQTLAQVGRCYRDVGAGAHAEWYLLQALRWARMLAGADLVIELLCELAEIAAQQARQNDDEGSRRTYAARDRARDRCFEVSSLVGRAADEQREVAVLLRVSDVLDDCGDHDDALALQCRALNAAGGRPARASRDAASAAPSGRPPGG